jgi:hypothetical protein|tara:strand:+ start:691 stop:1122 length:432 start_codon:yes stop_codon:yes gene_type:complete
MANIIPDAFKEEILKGTHNFASSGGNTFKLALYTDISGLSTSTTAFTTTNEVSSSGTNYSSGGNSLTNNGVSVPGSNTAVIDFADLTFSSVTLTAVGAMIYNSTNSNKVCLVLDFGGSKTATNGDFIIQFPAVGATTAIFRIA